MLLLYLNKNFYHSPYLSFWRNHWGAFLNCSPLEQYCLYLQRKYCLHRLKWNCRNINFPYNTQSFKFWFIWIFTACSLYRIRIVSAGNIFFMFIYLNCHPPWWIYLIIWYLESLNFQVISWLFPYNRTALQ